MHKYLFYWRSLFAVRDGASFLEVLADIVSGLVARSNVDIGDLEIIARGISGAVDAEDGVLDIVSLGTSIKIVWEYLLQHIVTLHSCLPVDVVDGDIVDAQRGRVCTVTVAHLLVITVVSSDNNGVFDIVEIDIVEGDTGDRA